MSKLIMKNAKVFINGQDVSSHCLRVVVDSTPGNLTVAAVSLFLAKMVVDDEEVINYYFGDLPDGV